MPKAADVKALEAKPPKISLTALQPYPKQQEIIDDNHRFKIVIFGRQSGKSWLARREALERAINRHQRVLWTAQTSDNARGHWNGIVSLLEKANFPVKAIRQTSREIIFYGGGSLTVRSTHKPDPLRGLTVDFIICDEAAYYNNGDYVWNSIIMPMVTASRGQVMITTTPNGHNWVHELYKQGLNPNSDYFKSWTMPSTESPYQDRALLEVIRKASREHVWRTEYLAEFLMSGAGIFAGLEAASILEPLQAPLPLHKYVAGLDWGGVTDATSVAIFDMLSGDLVSLHNLNIREMDKRAAGVASLLKRWGVESVAYEKNGMGESASSLLSLKYKEIAGKVLRTMPYHLDNGMKRAFVEDFAYAVEVLDTRLFSEKTDIGKTLIHQMSNFVETETKNKQGMTYKAREGEHDDLVMACVLGYSLVRKPMSPAEQVAKSSASLGRKGSPFKARRKR